ncbi:hypothetical protein FRC00_001385, partial [Tulasnella sp. 408]
MTTSRYISPFVTNGNIALKRLDATRAMFATPSTVTTDVLVQGTKTRKDNAINTGTRRVYGVDSVSAQLKPAFLRGPV